MLLPQQHLPPHGRAPAAVAGSGLPPVSAGGVRKEVFNVSSVELCAALAALATAAGALAGRARSRRRLGRTAMRIGLQNLMRTIEEKVKKDGGLEEGEAFWGPNESISRDMHNEQMQTINNIAKQMKKGRKKGPKFSFQGKTANPWRDRYMLCESCGELEDRGLPPQQGCEASTLVEVDMTMPFSRDNVVAMSCELAQIMRDDIKVIKNADGSVRRAISNDEPGAFRVRVCANCRKTSIDEGREFRMCEICQGVAYCSDECNAQDRLRHRATCTIPWLPYRAFWGIHRGLRKMRKEILPLIKQFTIREPSAHRIPWLPLPEHAKALPKEPVKLSLPGFGRQRQKLLPDRHQFRGVESKDGAIVHVPSDIYALRQPRVVRPSREPEEEHLAMMGMTREEWLEKDAELQASAAEEDARLMKATDALIEAKAAEGEKLRHMKPRFDKAPLVNPVLDDIGGPVTPGQDEPPAQLERLELSAESVERLQEASQLAVQEPRPEKELAPWLRPGFLEAQGGVTSLRPDAPAPEDRKDGVVYAGSFPRMMNKMEDLRLPEEAINRLETITALTNHTEKKRKFAVGMQKLPMGRRIFGDRQPWQNADKVVRDTHKKRAKEKGSK